VLDYKLIEALAMVAREHGFEKAARQLHITQSAVSQRIKSLEEHVGQVLLARTSPPRATPAGRQIIKHFQQVKQLETDLVNTLSPVQNQSFGTLAIGINGDSLATWFIDAVSGFLKKERLLLDLRSDDQEQTLQLLKNGEVIGCISAKQRPLQGCRSDYLGCMDYRLLATPEFAQKWFSGGLKMGPIRQAPLVIFNRKDELHRLFFQQAFKSVPADLNAHYLPSSGRFVDFISAGLAYGMLPDLQSAPLLKSGKLVELLQGCRVAVKLYWHCWNLNSRQLDQFSRHLVNSAKKQLKPK
jgi:LysR family transcriptional regulator (chromosome initiation inhibitor)